MDLYILIGILILVFAVLVVGLLRKRTEPVQGRGLASVDHLITHPERIHKVLTMALNSKLPLTIRLGGSDSAYTSYLLKIASIGRERQIYIDGLIPEEGNELIKESRDLQVSFVLREDELMQRSVPYEFRTVFIREIIKSGPRQIVIRFPNELQRRQRRDYLRVSPPEGAPAFIKVDIQGKEHRFKVWDISGGGVAFLTDLNDNIMKVGTELRDVQIEIPGMPIIRCVSVVHKKVKLRGVYMEEKQHTTYICGCVFKEIDEEDRQLIIKYVVSVERERLRRLKASPASIDKEE